PGPYPIPPNPPIEGGSDQHVLIIDRDHWKLFELFSAQQSVTGWDAGSGAIFDLNSDAHRPAGSPSADAAGLPIFPGLVRYDEVAEQGVIRHALRFTVAHPRRAYVSPATHSDGESYDTSLPPMGTRVRLKSSVDISGFPPHAQVILQALKTYGLMLADTGRNWFVSGTPDPRWNEDDLNSIRRITGRDFEVVKLGAVTQFPA
ncbi:MAG: hypothetical protein M3Y56_10100, partial [Armatimonadota bacterium]|nr:hypothetical protein [Armatimonadota bacterium]